MGVIDDILRFITSGSNRRFTNNCCNDSSIRHRINRGLSHPQIPKDRYYSRALLVVVAYLGFFGLSLGALKDLSDKYGPIAIQYGTLLIGLLPLGIGFIVGLIIGFVLS